ncbi:hypothetical protein Plhal710r2_c009g0040091 [Plasmopara halstedii]
MWTAEYTWNCYVHPICSNVKLIEGDLDWTCKCLSTYATATKLFRISAIQVVLNITRCCALPPYGYIEKKLYSTEVTTSVGYACNHARAYVRCTFASSQKLP